MSENEDKVFLAKLKGSKILPENDINTVVKAYQQLKKAGESVQLSDVFLNKGILSIQQIKNLKNSVKDPKVKFLSDYELTQKLGAGGMGAVYLGVHKETKKEFAIKVLSKTSSNSGKAVARFEREYRALTKLKHKNIIGGIEKGFSNGYHFYVMDYFKGQSLKEKAKTIKKNDYPFIIKLIIEIAVGLKFAHSKGFIHRDIKPDNIFITESKNEVKIIDFGLVKSENEDSLGLTQSQTAMGTPHFISCEQAKDAKRADLRSDIYSLGATFYYLITKEFPVKGSTAFEILTALISEEVVPPIKIDSEIPESINAVILHMMEKNPEDRYQNYDELLEDLQLISKGKPVTREFSSTIMTKHNTQRKRLNKKLLIPSVIVAIIIIIGLLFKFGDNDNQANMTLDPKIDEPIVSNNTIEKPVEEKKIIKEIFKNYRIPEKFNRAYYKNSIKGPNISKLNTMIDRLMSWLVVQKLDKSAPPEELLMTRAMLLLAIHGDGNDYFTSDHIDLMNSHLDEIQLAQKSTGEWGSSKSLSTVCTLALVEAYALKGAWKEEEYLESSCFKALKNLKTYLKNLKRENIDDFNDCPLGLNSLFLTLSLARFAEFQTISFNIEHDVLQAGRDFIWSNRRVFNEKLTLMKKADLFICAQIYSGHRRISKDVLGQLKNKNASTASEVYQGLMLYFLSNRSSSDPDNIIRDFGLSYFFRGKSPIKVPIENELDNYSDLNGKIITNALAVLAIQNMYKYKFSLRMAKLDFNELKDRRRKRNGKGFNRRKRR